MKKITTFLVSSILFALISIHISLAQSWNITGNNNATSNSKLGTTNLVPLKFFTNNSQRMILDSLGRVGIGITKPVNIFTVKSGGGTPAASWLNGLNTPVFVGFGETVSSEFLLAGASNTAINRAVFQGRRSRGTLASPTAVANDDYITSLLASAYDGSTFQNPALVSFFVDGTPSAGNVPARISFVTGSNAGNRTERLKVGSTGNFDFNNGQVYLQQSNGRVGIGITNPGAKLDVAGAAIFGGQVVSIGTSTGLPNERVMLFYDGNVARARLNTADNVGLGFGTSGINDRVLIDNNGNMGIGTTNLGNYKLKLSYDDGGSNTGSPGGLDIENTSTAYSGARSDWEIYTSPNNVGAFGNLYFFFDGNFKAAINSYDGQYYTTSDERLKTNIKPMSTMLNKIGELKPSTFQFKDDKKSQERNGFIAQDVMKIFPNLVVHNVNPERKLDVYTMDYSGFGVLAIKGIQELAPIIEEQKKINEEQREEIDSIKNADNLKFATLEDRIDKLEAALANITANKNGNISSIITNASLEQNIPNPFTHNTTIGYSLPENFTNAQIKITDKNGKILKTINISGSGKGTLNVDASILSSGAYNYSLFVNGKLVSTKQMERLK